MMNYRILTDSCCDLTQEMADMLELGVVPLSVNLEGKEFPNYLDHHALDVKMIYDKLRGGAMTSTTAANPTLWRDLAEPILKDGQDVMRTASHIATYSGFAILITVLGFNLLGDGIRDVLDPKMKK